jgi:UDP-2,3-diacylglucosamine hydrolase
LKQPVIYFASDQHFGAPNAKSSLQRELFFVKWLAAIKQDATHLFLLGDLFDFWFDYDKVVPKGFIRVLGKIAELKDHGVEIHFFVGNHDLWMSDYFEKELNIPIYRKPQEFNFFGKNLLIGHGDGLGPGDKGYKRMKKIFTNPLSIWLYKWLHPDIGVRLAQYLSVKNKLISGKEDVIYLGEDNEWLVSYCKRKLETKHYDYFIFGHRHLPLEIELNKNSKYINLGDWISYFTYCKMDKNEISLLKYQVK